MKRFLVVMGVLVALALGALAQDATEDTGQTDSNSFLVNLIERSLSAPGRVIRVREVTGALSSQARVGEVTLSDATGVWLRLSGVEIDWSRASLLLGRVNVNRLGVARIEYLRQAIPPKRSLADRLPEAEAQPFSLPELPVSVDIKALDLPQIVIAEAPFGQAAELASTGRLNLSGGALDMALDVQRRDAPGGALTLALSFANATREIAIDVDLNEPQGGVVATILDMENRPSIAVTAKGAGPLDNLDVAFAFDAGGSRIAGGDVTLRGEPEGLRFVAAFSGGLAPVVPAPYRAFFAGETTIDVAGVSRTEGGVRLDQLALQGAALDLTGTLDTAADGFPRSLALEGRIGNARGPALTLPVPGGRTRLHAGVLHLNYGGGRRWNGILALDRLVAGDVEIEDLTLDMGGIAENLDDPERRNLTVALEGVATGVWAADPDLAKALGTRLDLFADLALPAGGPLAIRQAQVSGNGLSLFAAGSLEGLAFDGRASARLSDIAPASGLAGRPLGGGIDLRVTGSVDALAGSFDLTLDGAAQDLRLGDPRLDGLLAGTTALTGGIARDTAGIRTDAFLLANPQIEITSSGRLSSRLTDLTLNATLMDLSTIDSNLAGALTLSGRAEGQGRPVRLNLTAEATDAAVMERPLTGARIAFDGALDGADLSGAVRGGADFDGAPIILAADIDLGEAGRTIGNLLAQIGPNTLTGGLTQAPGGTIDGALALRAPDVAPLAALVLTEASGAVDATVDFRATETGQGITVGTAVRDLMVGASRVDRLTVDAAVADAFTAPLFNGTADAAGIAAGGVEITNLSLRADQTDATTTQVAADVQLAIGTVAQATGALSRLPDGFAATLETLSLRQAAVAATLTAPATVTLGNGTVQLTPLDLDFGSGGLSAQGTVGETFDVSLDLRTLPLSIANVVQPALGLEGALTGTARVTGPRAAPDASFDLAGVEIASSQTRAAGLPPAQLSAQGRTSGGRLQIEAGVVAAGLDATARGTLPLGPGALAFDVTLGNFPLQIIDRVAGNRGLAGSITGAGRVGGTTSAPDITFELDGTGITATMLRDNGLSPMALSVQGGFAGNSVTLGALEVSNEQGLSVTASGRLPLAGPGLDLRASGDAPLSLANGLLADRTAEASGLARFDASVTGSLAAPQVNGSAAIEGGEFFDPNTNVRLRNVTAQAGFDGQAVVLESFRAEVPSGGAISADGNVSLNTAQGNPADLTLRFLDVRYTDGVFVSTRLNGELKVRGPLIGGGGVLSGQIDLGATEISVAEGLGGNAQGVLNAVLHKLPPPRVQETLDRARVGEPQTPQSSGRSGLQADVLIRAPNQIFVRGRGLDVELGGELRVTGPIADIVPVGQFDLRRGRLQVLGQRIEFDEGSLRLTGNLDPEVFFVARTRSDDVTAIITVSGRVSAPEITFSSQPTLPQDEVLARIIFNRSVGNLSAFQIAQLAAAAAELAGAGGQTGILGALRGAIGVDDLDIITGEDGQTAVRAGRYIDDNIYLDVQAEQDGDTRARINLDLNDSLTLRGSVSSDGNSTLGVFFERDY